jgi:hypothetical protein
LTARAVVTLQDLDIPEKTRLFPRVLPWTQKISMDFLLEGITILGLTVDGNKKELRRAIGAILSMRLGRCSGRSGDGQMQGSHKNSRNRRVVAST